MSNILLKMDVDESLRLQLLAEEKDEKETTRSLDKNKI